MMPATFQHRLFFALWPDSAVATALLQRQSGIEGTLVKADRLHLTLAFLGSRPAAQLPALRTILQRVPARAMTLDLDLYGYFSGPRIAWAGMRAPQPLLLQLQHALMEELMTEKIAPPGPAERFRPHVTLARKSAPPALPFAPLRWRAERMVLAESMPENGDYRIIAARQLD
jgi:2'-5' RNA ligase